MTYLVFMTVIGIKAMPLIVLATTPNMTASNGPKSPFDFPIFAFNQCRDEKYSPTPGTHRAIDGTIPRHSPTICSCRTMFVNIVIIPGCMRLLKEKTIYLKYTLFTMALVILPILVTCNIK